MSNFIKKENLVVVVGQYTDAQGQQKNEHKQIGELITMMGNDGPYQFFKLWGAHGVTEGKVWEPKDNSQQQPAQNRVQQGYQQPQQGYAPPQGKQGYSDDKPPF